MVVNEQCASGGDYCYCVDEDLFPMIFSLKERLCLINSLKQTASLPTENGSLCFRDGLFLGVNSLLVSGRVNGLKRTPHQVERNVMKCPKLPSTDFREHSTAGWSLGSWNCCYCTMADSRAQCLADLMLYFNFFEYKKQIYIYIDILMRLLKKNVSLCIFCRCLPHS